MTIDTCHFEIHVHSLDAARRFYVGVLGLEVIQDAPAIGLLAVKAGGVRISLFADAGPRDGGGPPPGGSRVIFRTTDLAATVAHLRQAGVAVPGAIAEAPGFLRFVTVTDPSGNPVEIAQYLRDPLQ